jgi:hypothetical protein
MNPNTKLLRAALAVLAVFTIAGCASNRNQTHPATNDREEIMLDRQINLTRLHPDTHPEWRLGLGMAFPTTQKSNARPEEYSTAVPQPEL